MKSEGDHVVIAVKDEGKGIPAKKLEKIFDRFERATNKETVTGLGLGLFIVKQIAEGHGGTVEVDSILDHGTTFKVVLPKRVNVQPPQEKESPEAHLQ
jgi:signal transduction histidine kinase